MDNSQHTPGPWDEDDGFIFAESTREPVARMPDYTGNEPQAFFDRMEANARLIIAAPELLEACKAACNCIGELSPTQARVEVAQMLQAAIAAATGSTHE